MDNTVRKKQEEEEDEFGKDHGLIHEAIITGKKVGAGKPFWSALAHNEVLFARTKAFVESGGQITGTGVAPVNFPTWKTVLLGTHKDVEALRKAMESAGIKIGDYERDGNYASSMLQHQMFTLAAAEIELELVRVSVADLGFAKGATCAKIYAAALRKGLSLCPAEVGPQIRLQYLGQPYGEWLLIGMESIYAADCDPSMFYVGHGDNGLWLSSRWNDPDSVWSARHVWVFCRSKPAR